MNELEATFVVIGGGIAGVSCVETLAFLETDESIILISESSLIKTVVNLHNVTKCISNFDVEERHVSSLEQVYSNLKVIDNDSLFHIDSVNNKILTKNQLTIKYKFLCLCTGATPKIISQAIDNYVITIRDTDSVENLVTKLKDSKKIIIVGNGGIASELIYKIKNVEVHWVIKDNHITSTFIDPGASEFFRDSLFHKIGQLTSPNIVTKRMRYDQQGHKSGAALGPDWYQNLDISGSNTQRSINIHNQCEISNIEKLENSTKHPLLVKLSNGNIIECDLIVSATGVKPEFNYTLTKGLVNDYADENGLLVNQYLQTNIEKNIYAAGDICSANWQYAKHWFPMKLWTQARQMGSYVAKSMSGAFNQEEVLQDFCFELFTHSTKLFGYKVILLGLFNGQKLNQDYEILLRTTKDMEYIKFIIGENRLQGAILIGETDLEEMCENLILNQIDLSPYGDDILNPDIDIEDYFD